MTGENKERFEEWYYKNYNDFDDDYRYIVFFYRTPFEMQKGVYEAYYKSIGIIIEEKHRDDIILIWDYREEDVDFEVIDTEYLDEENEAWEKAFYEANILINDEL